MRIAICDDEPRQIEIIKEHLQRVMGEHQYSVVEANSGEVLLEIVKEDVPELVFLDIEMDKLSGIDTGKTLREMNSDTIIVFVTGFKDFALQAFGLRAFDYVIKPLTKNKFDMLFSDLTKRMHEIKLRKEKNRRLLVKTRSGMVDLPYDEIVFFEKSGHQVVIHTKSHEEIQYYGSFKGLKTDLAESSFAQCHQGYIVNMDYVSSYRNKSIRLKDDFDQLPVSKSFLRSIKNEIEDRLFK
jgi:DNA-binding LytR/AlgR family response regulator